MLLQVVIHEYIYILPSEETKNVLYYKIICKKIYIILDKIFIFL